MSLIPQDLCIEMCGSTGRPQPLRFYMFNPETDEDHIINVEIIGSSIFDVFQTKFEGRKSPSLRLSDCSDIRWFGVGRQRLLRCFHAALRAGSR
jgi:hypothetical protein